MAREESGSVYEDLKWRGLIAQATEGIREWLDGEPARAYIGFDPTGPSLHVGSLLPLTMLARLQRAGHHPIALVGGATGMIGDPSGKSAERNLLSAEQVEENVRGLRAQIERLLSFEGVENPAAIVNNADWLGRMNLIEYLRDVGKHFTVNAMLAKESVKRRVSSEQGISYTEFSYLILQAYDFLHLYESRGVTCQMGATDQWGNITAGCDLIRSKKGARVQALVHPLITRSDGSKFGKTEEGAVWLDPERTSPYRFYQFWIQTTDEDVISYLKMFTFLDREEVLELERAHREAPHRREAHARLAREVTRAVHGEDGLARAERATKVLFGGTFEGMSSSDLLDVFSDVPSAEIARERFSGSGAPLVDLLADPAVGAARSKGDARRQIQGGGVYVNNRRVDDVECTVRASDLIDGRLLVIRRGKKNYHLIRVSGGGA